MFRCVAETVVCWPLCCGVGIFLDLLDFLDNVSSLDEPFVLLEQMF